MNIWSQANFVGIHSEGIAGIGVDSSESIESKTCLG